MIKAKNVLALDASNGITNIAWLINGQKTLVQEAEKNSQIEKIFSLTAASLKDLNLKVRDLDLIVLGQGPGSFTGLRISYAFILGVAVQNNIAVTEQSSFMAAALKSDLNGEFVVSCSAGRNKYIAEVFQRVENKIASKFSARLYDEEEYLSLIKDHQVLDLAKASHLNIADGLLDIVTSLDSLDLTCEELQELEPNYIRSVAAKKISER